MPSYVHRKAYNIAGHAHELTFTCYRRYRFLQTDRIRNWLARAMTEALVKHDFALYAYVIMPEHVHLVVHPRSKAYRVSDFLHDVKAPVGRQAMRYLEQCREHQWLQRLTRRRGRRVERVFWQSGGGYDRNIHTPATLGAMVDYIHHNPVRRGLVSEATDWTWSSARWHILGETGPIPVDPMTA